MCLVYSAATGMSSLNMKLADVRRWPDIGMALTGLLLARKARTFSIHCSHPFSALVPSWFNVGPECRRRWASTGPGRLRVSYLMRSI